MKRLIFVIILAFVIAPALAMNYTPAGDDLTVSGVYSGEPGDTKLMMIDGDLGTRWTSSSTSWWFNYTNPNGYNITTVALYGFQNRYIRCNDGGYHAADDTVTWRYYTDFTPTTSFIRCQGNGATYARVYELKYADGAAEPAMSVNFTCDPLSGVAPFSTTCNPQGTGFTQYLWDWGDTSTTNTTSSSVSHLYNLPDIYTIRLDAFSSAYSTWYNVTKTDYIAVENASTSEGGINLIVHTYDAQKSAKVAPSQIKMQNTTSGLWLNWSTTGGTAIFDSMDPPDDTELLSVGQTVKLCGYAPGYAETCGNLTIPYNNYEHSINLIATDAVPTAGNSTLIVNVIDSRTAARIAGATITVSNTSVPYSSSKLGDSNGVATFAGIPAAGAYQISVSKTGYVSATRFWPVASGEISNAYIGILPIGATPVPTGTGGDPIYDTPTITGTTLAPGATPDTRTDEEKDADMMGILRDNGETLIQFFILCFVLYMIMGIGGRK